MATIEIKDPKTGRTIRIDGERLPNQEEIAGIMASIGKQPDAGEKPKTELEILQDAGKAVSGFTDEAANTFTLGLSNTVRGAGSFLSEFLFGDRETAFTPEEQVERQSMIDVIRQSIKDPERRARLSAAFNQPQEEREEFREESPGAAVVASVIGGIANPVGQKVGGFIARAGSLGQRTTRAATGGALIGGGQAAGEAGAEAIGEVIEGEGVDVAEKVGKVGIGASFGAIVGAALPPLADLAKGLFGGIINTVMRFSDKRQATLALRKVTEALQRDGFTPEQALARVERLGPEAALLDVGENSRALAFSAAGIPGQGKATITQFLQQRQEGVRSATGRKEITGGQINRIQKHLDNLIPQKFFSVRQALRRENQAAQLYKNAYAQNQSVESPEIDRLLKTPDGRRAFKEARKTLQNLQKNLAKSDPELTEQLKETGEQATGRGVGRGLKLEFLDKVKQELWTLEQAAKVQSGVNAGKTTPRSDSINAIRRQLTQAMDDADVTARTGPSSVRASGGDYAKARRVAGDKLSSIEALENGKDFMSKGKFGSPEELEEVLSSMTPEQRHSFRIGAAQALRSKLGGLKTRQDATKQLIDIPDLELKIRQAFGTDKLMGKYVDFLENEKELFRAVTDVLSNSKTAAREASLVDAKIDPSRILQGFRDITSGQPGGLIRGTANIAQGLSERVSIPQAQSGQIADVLTGRSVEGLRNPTLETALATPQVQAITQQGAPKTLEELLIRSLAPLGADFE